MESFNENPAFLMRSKAKTGCSLMPIQRQITDCKEIYSFEFSLLSVFYTTLIQ